MGFSCPDISNVSCQKSEQSLIEDVTETTSRLERNLSIDKAVEKLSPIMVASYKMFEKNGALVGDQELSDYLVSTGFITREQIEMAVKDSEALSSSLRLLSREEARYKHKEILLSFLSANQIKFTDELSIRANSGGRDFDDIYTRAKKDLSDREYVELEQVLMATEVLIRALDNFKGVMPDNELRATFLEKFACGAVTSGIGSVWGTMAGGILTLSVSVPVAGWIGGAVAIISGAALGAAIC